MAKKIIRSDERKSIFDWMLIVFFTSAITIIIIALTLMFKDGAEQVLPSSEFCCTIKAGWFLS
jgi:choline/glycine/proline betaine transport protein